MRLKIILDYFSEAREITQILIKGRKNWGRGNHTDGSGRDTWTNISGFQNEEGHESRDVGNLQKLKRAGEWILP